MHIVVISHSFPTNKTIDFVFVEQLCCAFADKGENVTVIAPQSFTKCVIRGIPFSKVKSRIHTESGSEMMLYRPFWCSLGTGGSGLNKQSFDAAVLRALRRIRIPIDVIYGHFWAQAIAAMPFAIKNNIPVFAVAGEGELTTHQTMTEGQVHFVKDNTRGVICVASKSKRESIQSGFATEDMCVVIPNSIDPSLFYQRDQREMRRKHGFPLDAFIVAFVGQWNSRKGVKRLSKALESLHDERIKAIFMGKGAEVPDYGFTLYAGTVNHDILPEYLCCADVFVLPTVNEGCCNAVIEAMACGLPILSADKEFNWDVLDETNSILFDPLNINQIADSIKKVFDDKELRENLSKGSLIKASQLTLDARAEKILTFIKSRLTN